MLIFLPIQRKKLFLSFLLSMMVIIGLHLGNLPLIVAQSVIQEGHYYVPEELSTFTVEQVGLRGAYPNWNKITLSRFGAIGSGGVLNSNPLWNRAVGYDLSRTWNAGDNPSEFLKLGDFPNSYLGNLTLNQIMSHSLTEIGNSNSVPLSAFGLLSNQSIKSLVKAIPALENYKVKDVKPIFNLVGSSYAEDRIERLTHSRVGNRIFGQIDLNQYTLRDIPFLSQTRLSKFKNWRNTFIERVPGLWDLPLTYFLDQKTLASSQTYVGGGNVTVTVTPGILGVVDLPLGTAEAGISNTISGSYQEGFNVACNNDCAHLELGDWSLGNRWISGKYQELKGGFGVLGGVNGGKEPTGRHPFGSAFKVAIWDVDEAEGRIDTALFFRFCKRGLIDLGCTPYCIGPIPFLSYNEMDTMFVGLLDNSIDVSYNPGSVYPVSVPPPDKPIPPGNGGLINPLPDSIVTSEYGYRRLKLKSATTFHEAIDLAYSTSDPRYPGQIIASGDGVVKYAGFATGCGTLIRIDHGNGLMTGYCHQQEMYVQREQPVLQGQVIAKVGNEGNSSAPHLHFIIYENGRKVNPRKYVKF